MMRYPCDCMYFDTPWLARHALLDNPTTAMVRLTRSSFSSSLSTLGSLLTFQMQQLTEPLQFFSRQRSPMCRRQRTQFQKGNLYPPQLLHHQSEGLEHQPDLILPPLDQLDLIPRILSALEHFQLRWSGAPPVYRNALAKFLFLLCREITVGLHLIRFWHLIFRRQNCVREVTVIG